MLVAIALVSVGLTVTMTCVILRQQQRHDLEAQILGVAPPRHGLIGLALVVLSAALVSLPPTLIVWVLLG